MSHFFQMLNVFHFRRVFSKNAIFFVKKRGVWMYFFYPGILLFQEIFKSPPPIFINLMKISKIGVVDTENNDILQ